MKIGDYTYNEGDLVIWGDKVYRDQVISVKSLLKQAVHLHIGVMGMGRDGELGWRYIDAHVLVSRIREGILEENGFAIKEFLKALLDRDGVSRFPPSAVKWASPFMPIKPIMIGGEEYI